MTSITLPNSVTSIGYGAFTWCTNLKSIEIPNSVKNIETYAFRGCSGLTSFTIPNSMTSLGDRVFSGCSNLESVTFGSGITRIENRIFEWCPKLTDVYCYAKTVPSTHSGAFKNSGGAEGSDFYVGSATLHVPETSLTAYQTTDPWNSFGTIKALDGEIPETPETPKCATPTINYADGELSFDCETESVEFVSHVEMPSSFDSNSDKLCLSTTCVVTVFAKKDGYEDSDVATEEINIGGSAAGIKGDVNEDGNVNGTDIQEIINIIIAE